MLIFENFFSPVKNLISREPHPVSIISQLCRYRFQDKLRR